MNEKKPTFEMLKEIAGFRYYYIASPYSHKDPEIIAARVRIANHQSGYLMTKGLVVYCPVYACHEATEDWGLETSAEYWNKYNDSFMRWAAGMIILDMHGWRESKGIKSEIEIMRAYRRPIVVFTFADAKLEWYSDFAPLSSVDSDS